MKRAPLVLSLALPALVACSDLECPEGKKKVGSSCYVIGDPNAADAGDATASSTETMAGGDRSGENFEAGSHALQDSGASGVARADSGTPSTLEHPNRAEDVDTAVDSGSMSPVGDACSGAGCREVATCATDPCPEGAACMDGAGGRSCDYCAPNPCQNAGMCTNGASTFTCACPAGFTGESCELEICGSITVRTRADLDANQRCAEIHGDLVLTPNFSEIGRDDFPSLSRITGRLVVSSVGASSGGVPFTKLTLTALQVVEGYLTMGQAADFSELHLPALTSVGVEGTMSGLSLNLLPKLKVIEMPELTEVRGDFGFDLMNLPNLCSANVRRITRIDGRVQLELLPNLPYSATARIRSAANQEVEILYVGCCTVVDTFGCETLQSLTCASCSG